MNKREKLPISCRECRQEFCVPCGQFATPIDYKTRTGVCKKCAAKNKRSILERANAHSLLGAAKMNTLADCLNRVKDIPGATAELGVYKGGSALLIASTIPATQCYLFDTFSGIPFKGENDVHDVGDFKDSSLDAVKSLLKDCTNAQYRVGLFPESVTGLENETYKFVHVDGDQYQTTKDALEYFYPRMVEGGIMLFDDFGWKNCPGVAKALNEFLADKGEGLEYPHLHQAMIIKGRNVNKSIYDVCHSADGIGDAITALYACVGAAKAGYKIRLHTRQAHWLRRASFHNVEIILDSQHRGINLSSNYSESLNAQTCRKSWYAQQLIQSANLKHFEPAQPLVDTAIREKRIDIEKYVVLSPFSAWSGREWPKPHWQRLVFLLDDLGYKPVVIHGSGEEAKKRLHDYFVGTPAIWYWGMSPEWVEDVMLGAHAFIGNDSGMAHLAALLGVRTISIHAQVTAEQLWGYTDVISVMPNAFCIGCGWKPERGWRRSCDTACSALYTASPQQVLKELTGHEKSPVLSNKNEAALSINIRGTL